MRLVPRRRPTPLIPPGLCVPDPHIGGPWLTRRVWEDVCAVDHLDGRLGRLATAQGGVIARRQALALGATRRTVDARLARGLLIVLFPSVYALGHAATNARGRAIAALLAVPGSVLSHRTAAAIWGLLLDALIFPDVTVTVPTAGTRRTIRVHRSRTLEPQDVLIRRSLPLTSLPRTLLDLAETAPEHVTARAVREARVNHHSQPHHIKALLSRSPGRRGAAVLTRILDGPDAEPTRSQTERAMLRLLAQAGLPRPEVNVEIGRHLCDFLWREAGLIIETDGWDTHGDRNSFESDRARDAELASSA